MFALPALSSMCFLSLTQKSFSMNLNDTSGSAFFYVEPVGGREGTMSECEWQTMGNEIELGKSGVSI